MESTDFYRTDSDRHIWSFDNQLDPESLSQKEKCTPKWVPSLTFSSEIPERQLVQWLLRHSVWSLCMTSRETKRTQGTDVSDTVARTILLYWLEQSRDQIDTETAQRWWVISDSTWEKHRREAFRMLHDIELYLEDTDQLPSPVLVECVENLVEKLFETTRLPVHVDGTPEGDILVTVFNNERDTLMIYCDFNGDIQCRLTMDGQSTKKNFDSIQSLLDSTYMHHTLRLISSS